MTEEAKVTVSVHNWRRGDRIQVDIHDERVRGLIKAGYLKIIWKETGDARTVDSAGDPDGPGNLPRLRVGARTVQASEAQVDGDNQAKPAKSDSDIASADKAAHHQNK